MCENTSDFSDVKVGDKLWSVQLGECKVYSIDVGGIYRIYCTGEGAASYTISGLYGRGDVSPSLFWSRPEIIAPPRTKRKVVNTVEAWVNIYPDMKIKHSSCIHTSEESANEEAGSARIACVHLTGTYEFFE